MMTDQEAPIIIVVDDSEDDFFLIKRQLLKTWQTATVRHAHCESSLRDALDELEPDVVICDYSMPQLTHDRTIALVTDLRPNTPVILLSGLASDATGVQAMHAGVRDYVEKSKLERLMPAVRREIHTHRLHRDKLLLEQAHRRAVYFDTTTGFLNRQGLVKTLSGLREKTGESVSLSLLSINVSRNQARRPEVDRRVRRNMLEKTIDRLKDTFRQDILCRWSDNVFVVVSSKLDWSGSHFDMTEVLCRIEADLNRPFQVDNIAVRPNMRLGLARPGVHGEHAAELVTHAQSVANVIESDKLELFNVLDDGVHNLARRRKTIELGLSKGIENHELVLDFQPIEDLKTGRICGVEALVRWTHPELGRIMPCEFIGVAEDSGLIDALGEWVIESSSRKLLELHAQGHMLWCAVNCAAGQLMNPDFPAKASQIICATGLDPKWIEFEVTESAAINDMSRTIEALNKLKVNGSKIAMDDFGTGYASLNYLRQLPVDVLKIDKSFVMDLLEDKNSHMIVKAVIDLAHALGLIVHAEGIETAAQRESLLQMGCDRLQGYWFSKPMDLQALLGWLKESPA
jgi:EAL domain-containing protein (putative c-di-GMP-specific phosphodiesterase class I)/FixJ family two-component response regulator